MPTLQESIQQVAVLNAAEAERAWRTVHELREHWVPRRGEIPFYTLGAASYLDAANGHFAAYQERARHTNPLLAEHFGWLLDRLAEAFSRLVNWPVFYSDRLALPGFHVFLSHPSFATEASSIHHDLQYQSIDWSEIGVIDPTQQRSLTLSVRLPASGAGLRIWDLDVLEMAKMSEEQQRAWGAAHRKPIYVPYQVGTLLIHGGHRLHQIAPIKDQRPEDERVTLQAHALPAGDRWVMYW